MACASPHPIEGLNRVDSDDIDVNMRKRCPGPIHRRLTVLVRQHRYSAVTPFSAHPQRDAAPTP